MHNAIEIKNLKFSYGKNVIFDDLDLIIKEKRFVTLLGKNCSGKTTLAKILVGLQIAKGEITINGVTLNEENVGFIRKDIGIVFENPNDHFTNNIVYDDIAFTLECLDYYPNDIKEKIKETTELLGIEELLDREINDLSNGEKQLVALAEAIIHKPKLLILDDALTNIDNYYKEIILKILNIMRKKGMTILNITSNSDDSLFGTDIVIINEGKVVLNKTLLRAFKEEKTFINSGLTLPFIVDLSLKLNYYDLINKIYLDKKSLVDEIWK